MKIKRKPIRIRSTSFKSNVLNDEGEVVAVYMKIEKYNKLMKKIDELHDCIDFFYDDRKSMKD